MASILIVLCTSAHSYAAVFVSDKNGRVLMEEAADSLLQSASTVKLLTAVLVVDNLDLNKRIPVSRKAASVGGNVAGLRAGEKYSVIDLLHLMLMNSGNDAAIALAEGTAGSVGKFVVLMNERARRMGLTESIFTDPAGLDSRQRTKARDLAALMRQITEEYPVISNVRNSFVCKTGYTAAAGHCIVSAYQTKNNIYYIVVLNEKTRDLLWKRVLQIVKTINKKEIVNES